ncbi:Muc22p [Xylographa trunciseda]|nr:Muc22p [Xylographa trunciseda]
MTTNYPKITPSSTTTTKPLTTPTTTSQPTTAPTTTAISPLPSTLTSGLVTISTTSTTTTHMVTAPATPIYNVVGNGNFVYDASAPGGLALWNLIGDAMLVAGNAYHVDGNTGNYAVLLFTDSTSPGRRFRRQTNGGAAGIEQILSGLDMTTTYTVSLWYYVDYTVPVNAAPQNCKVDAYYGSNLLISSPYFAANNGQASQWVQLLATVTPSTSNGNLLISLDCINSGAAEALIDEVFVSNQVTPNDIDNISLTYALAPLTPTSTSTTSQGPSSVAQTSIAPPNPTCTIRLNLVFPNGAVCQKQVASISTPNELYIYGPSGISYVDCAAACLANTACSSFGWGPMSGNGQCILFPQSVSGEALPSSSSAGFYTWDRACWKYYGPQNAACVVSSSTTTTSTTTATTTTGYMAITSPSCPTIGCSTILPSPASTCTDLLPNPSPPCNAVCGVIGGGIQDQYQGTGTSESSCQLGCLQSPTCKSWAWSSLASYAAAPCSFSDAEFLWSTFGAYWGQSNGGGLSWYDNECFYCAGDVAGSSCSFCPNQLVTNPSFESYIASGSTAAPWTFASYSSLQPSGSAIGAVDGAMMAQLRTGYFVYTYGQSYGQPTSSWVSQNVSCFDTSKSYVVDFYWYLHSFAQASTVTTTTCAVYAQIGGTTVFTTSITAPGDTQASTWVYTHSVSAAFTPPTTIATLVVGADCGGSEGYFEVDLITIYPLGGSSGLTPNYEYPSP